MIGSGGRIYKLWEPRDKRRTDVDLSENDRADSVDRKAKGRLAFLRT